MTKEVFKDFFSIIHFDEFLVDIVSLVSLKRKEYRIQMKNLTLWIIRTLWNLKIMNAIMTYPLDKWQQILLRINFHVFLENMAKILPLKA